ncbi:MAG: CDP-6-deoxy-delta-3,4-glucoseen reductase [Acidiferrobacterales bacterium]
MNFRVRVEPSGHEFSVEPGEPILAAALRAGLALPYSCRDGACGSCKGKIVSGSVDYGEYEKKALSDEERSAGKALFCQAVPQEDLVVEVREVSAAAGIAIKILPGRVMRIEHLAHDVMAVYLKLPQTQRLQFLAGQYIDILLRDGRRRSFSLANPPHDDEFLQLHVRHVPGGQFTGHVFGEMKERDLLRLQGPFGIFFLRDDSNLPILFMAGGTGFAPIKSIVEHAFAKGETRPMHLFWGARCERDLYLHELALSWDQQYENFRYTPVLSEPQPEDDWQGRTGWVHEVLSADYPDLSGFEVYASGPPPMIEAGRDAFFKHGLADDRFYFDSFEFSH